MLRTAYLMVKITENGEGFGVRTNMKFQ